MDYKVLYEINYFNIIVSKLLSIYTIIGMFLLIAVIFYTLNNIIFKTEKFTLLMCVRLIGMLIVGGVIKSNGQKLRICYKLRISEEYKNDPAYFEFENEDQVFESRCKENIILKIEEIE